jgi:hypothetical protein
MLSIFYTKKEIATRISILFTGNICGTAFAGLIAIGVFKNGWRCRAVGLEMALHSAGHHHVCDLDHRCVRVAR